jgi:hypothetical protein
MPPGVLRTYRNRTLELLREGTVDRAWLEGMDSFADDGEGLPEVNLE